MTSSTFHYITRSNRPLPHPLPVSKETEQYTFWCLGGNLNTYYTGVACNVSI